MAGSFRFRSRRPSAWQPGRRPFSALKWLAKRDVEIAVGVGGGHDGHERHAVADEGDVVTDLEVLVTVEGEFVYHGATVDDGVELDGDLGLQHECGHHAPPD